MRPYEQDFNLWIKQTVQQLKNRQFDAVDWENLLEEIESLSGSDRRELNSRLIRLFQHLLKWQYQLNQRLYYGNSWLSTINHQRNEIELILEKSPSLQPYISEILEKYYGKARRNASKETGLAIDFFPVSSPFTLEETLNFDYFPE